MKPMLAAKYEAGKAIFPLMGSVKVDGVRVLIDGGVALSRSLKPIPNHFVQRWVRDNREALQGIDGELAVGPLNAADCFRRTSSGVMSAEGEPDFKLWAFDLWDRKDGFESRYYALKTRVYDLFHERLTILNQTVLPTNDHVERFMRLHVEEGHEGVMLRDPLGKYKFGRSTVKEQGLLKLKAFEDAEAVVVALHQEMHNANEAYTNEVGATARSSHQENMVGKGTLGALEVRSDERWPGVTFRIGTGFDAKQRKELWEARDLIGKTVKFKFFATGGKEAPRFPVFLGFRDERDMS